MDKDTRNRIQRATQAARALLEQEYAEQLEGEFDIRLDGDIAAAPGEHLDAEQRVLRGKLVAAVEHQRSGGKSAAEAVAGYRREAAFTTLNRFVALKMLEARGLLQECISRGENSSGFREFTGLAPGLVQLPDHGYRLYIEALFDEIGREVRVLFDRRDPAGLLWPRRQALNELLDVLNAAELAAVWSEDETIGWVYQYFNGDDERKQMRAESQAPRNSRELAVRNQFFTPRYVVQFLTDNSLGRIWYEMRQGDTALAELDYLVRSPDEVFLADGEAAPQQESDLERASDDEASDRETDEGHSPTYVTHRALKDPRDLRILDPACGSGHFLLYTFDLLLAIYQEAWQRADGPVSEATGQTLRDDYPELEALQAALPGLILRHNLHGIDIDPRAAQIAALALWMRAQRAANEFGIGRGERLPIRKTNIVVAEPMPGERELRDEFIASLEPKLGQLVGRVFEQMALAGEAGSLLRIEQDIARAVQQVYGVHGDLFSDVDAERWAQAEDALLAALADFERFARNSGGTEGYRRRLFADDAGRGLGFIDLCRLRYDVVLMNPPFGRPTDTVFTYLKEFTTDHYQDIAAAFIARREFWAANALIGAIAPRPMLIMRYLEDWRRTTLLKNLNAIVDLGTGVMDDAIVRTCCYVLSEGKRSQVCNIFLAASRSEVTLKELCESKKLAQVSPSVITTPLSAFSRLPFGRIPFRLPLHLLRLFDKAAHFEPAVGTARQGPTTSNDFRFLRLWWEVPPSHIGKGRCWERHAKGGGSGFYYRPIHLLIKRQSNGAELAAFNINVNGNYSPPPV